MAMRFRLFPLLALGAVSRALDTTTAVIPGPPLLVPRDMSTISSVISSIRTDVVSLDSVANAYTGGSITSIQASLDELLDSVTTGAAVVAELPYLTNLDALALVTPLQTLGSAMATTMNDLVAQDSLVASAGTPAVDTIIHELQALLSAWQSLSDYLNAKMPAALTNLFITLTASISTSIQTALSAFEALPRPTTTTTATTVITTLSTPTTPTGTTSSGTIPGSSTPIVSSSSSHVPSSSPVRTIQTASTTSTSTPMIPSSIPSASIPVIPTSRSLGSTPIIRTSTPQFTPSTSTPAHSPNTASTSTPASSDISSSKTGQNTSTATVIQSSPSTSQGIRSTTGPSPGITITTSTASTPCETPTKTEITSTPITFPAGETGETATTTSTPCETLTEIEVSNTIMTLPVIETATKISDSTTSPSIPPTGLPTGVSVNGSGASPSGLSLYSTLLRATDTPGGKSQIAGEPTSSIPTGSGSSASTSTESNAPLYTGAAVGRWINSRMVASLALCTLMVAFRPLF